MPDASSAGPDNTPTGSTAVCSGSRDPSGSRLRPISCSTRTSSTSMRLGESVPTTSCSGRPRRHADDGARPCARHVHALGSTGGWNRRSGNPSRRLQRRCTGAMPCGWTSALDPVPTRLVANLPYSIATPLVMESLWTLHDATFWAMVQHRSPTAGPHRSARPLRGAVGPPRADGRERRSVRFLHGVHAAAAWTRRSSLWSGWRPQTTTCGTRVRTALAQRRRRSPTRSARDGTASVAGALERIGRKPSARAQELRPDEFASLAEALRA